ncbi:hypothetical protein ACPCTO_35495 [Streptomyces olivoreticuli]
MERQAKAMREPSRRAFPEPEPNGGPAPLENTRAECRRQADATHASALRRACAERAGLLPAGPPQPLRRTA